MSALGIVALSLFLALFLRLWFLQGIDRQEFEAASASNRLRIIHDEGPRGRILDRNGKVLVDYETSIVVALDREPLRKLDESARQSVFADLADTLERMGWPTKVVDLQAAFEDVRYAPQEYVPVAEGVSTDVEIHLSERSDRFPGVIVQRKAVRTYPYGSAAVHLLGYVSQINGEELAERGGADGEQPATAAVTKDYRPGDTIGKSGVERTYENDLRGVPGQRTIEVDARGELVDVVSVDPPRPGDDVWLSIDIDLQVHAERQLAAQIHALRGRTLDGKELRAPQGSVVVQDPRNGQIRAMASYPDYDPATTVNGISTAQWNAFKDSSSGYPLVNWALQGAYAPGSTFKLFTAYAGLRTGYLQGGNGVVNDTGLYRVEGCRTGKCEFRNAGGARNGVIGLEVALSKSSDVYFYKMADMFWRGRDSYGPTPIQDAAAQFGLGSPTGIPLPGEVAGRLPTPDSRAAAYEARPDVFEHGDWFAGDNINTSIGQGDVLATPLQLADSYATFANGDTRFRPQIVSKVTRPPVASPDGDATASAEPETLREIAPEALGTVEFEGDWYGRIFAGLLGVTESGTAASAFSATPTAWPMAGKTGTSEVLGKADTALFAGWGPAVPGVAPEYAIAIVIPEAGFGGEVAAPLAFRILQPVSTGQLQPACRADDRLACDLAALVAAEQSRNEVVGTGE